MPPDQKRDYAVGYGKPPRRSRFPKGQSGNPPGRSPGAKNLKALLSDALNEFVIVTENGGHRKITTREAIITQLVNRSVSRFSRDQDPPRHGAGYRRPDRAGICRDRLLQRGGREGHRAAQGALLESGKVMIENLTREQYDAVLRKTSSPPPRAASTISRGNPSWLRSCLGSPDGARLAGGSPKAGETDLALSERLFVQVGP
jgi:hypothetical protein